MAELPFSSHDSKYAEFASLSIIVTVSYPFSCPGAVDASSTVRRQLSPHCIFPCSAVEIVLFVPLFANMTVED